MWPRKGLHVDKSASAARTPHVSGAHAEQRDSLSAEHTNLKMLKINSGTDLTAFTGLLVMTFTFILEVCLLICMFYLYTGKRYV